MYFLHKSLEVVILKGIGYLVDNFIVQLIGASDSPLVNLGDLKLKVLIVVQHNCNMVICTIS